MKLQFEQILEHVVDLNDDDAVDFIAQHITEEDFSRWLEQSQPIETSLYPRPKLVPGMRGAE